MARASIMWLVGEYAERVPKIAPDVLRNAAKTFMKEVCLSVQLCIWFSVYHYIMVSNSVFILIIGGYCEITNYQFGGQAHINKP